jgi:hypothetical protein
VTGRRDCKPGPLHLDAHIRPRAIDDGVGSHLGRQVLLDLDAETGGLTGILHVFDLAVVLGRDGFVDDGVRFQAGARPMRGSDHSGVLVHVEVHGRVLVVAVEVANVLAGGREAPVAAGSTPCPPVVDDGGLFRTAKVGLREIEGQPRARVLNQIPHAQPSLAAMVAAGPDGLNLMVDIPQRRLEEQPANLLAAIRLRAFAKPPAATRAIGQACPGASRRSNRGVR